MGASVKIMLSYDYCHFEICKSTDETISDTEINTMRKDAQRLANEAVRQYKKFKEFASKREMGSYQMQQFEAKCKEIGEKDEQNRTVGEMAMLKQYQDENWRKNFEYSYDFEDDYGEND